MEAIPEDLKADLAKEPTVEVILGQTFRVWFDGQSAHDYWVRMTSDGLLLSPTRTSEATPGCLCQGCCRGGDLKLYQKDIVACRPAQHEDSFMKNSLKNKVKPKEVGHPVFMIIAYPQWKGNKRQKKSLFFHYLAPEQRKQGLKSSGHYELTEAVRIRDTWVHSILTTFFPSSDQDFDSGVVQVSPDGWSPSSALRRLLLVLNPASGVGKSTKIMRSLVGPVLQESGMEYEVLITERQGHAHEVIRSEPNLSKRWKGIVTLGGDGTFYEVLNGIFARPDWQDILKQVPLGIIPAGSGNGLSRSLIYSQNEPFEGSGCLSSCLNVARGNTRPMDLYLTEQKAADGVQQNLGFLQMSYGLMANIDIESEVLQSLGQIRFAICGLLKIATLQTYKAKIWYRRYVPPSSSEDESSVDEDDDDENSTTDSDEQNDHDANNEQQNIEQNEEKISENVNKIEDKVDHQNNAEEIGDNGNDVDDPQDEIIDFREQNVENEDEENISVSSDKDSSDESIAEATSEEERDVQELTLDLEKKIHHQSGSTSNPDHHAGADYNEQNEDDTEDLIDNSPDVYTSQRATYASLLTQGHLYFRSWNELQTQIVRDPKNFPSQFQPTLPLPTPPPMLPPIRPQRQKIESPITDLSQDLKPESHDGWTFEENEYISITLLNTPFIDNKLFLAPESKLDDGLLYLMLVRKGVSKSRMVKLLMESESGNHVKIPGIEIIPVKAFRMVPTDNDSGFLTMDGESIPVGPIQAQIVPSMLNLFVK